MNNNDQSIYKNGQGGYIFISHSHLDIDKVRIIRNVLEREGFEPLCFFLKCLTDDDEVEGLIKREIDSRDIFIYIESENSKNSIWVTKEREYIDKCKNKTVYTIKLDENTDLEKETLRIINKSRVFISYVHSDSNIAKELKNHLIDNDLRVFIDEDMLVGVNWMEFITNKIKEACENGCLVYLVSERSLQSHYVQSEVFYAFRQKGTIIPVVIGELKDDIPNAHLFREFLKQYNHIFISDNPTKEEYDNVVTAIKKTLADKE